MDQENNKDNKGIRYLKYFPLLILLAAFILDKQLFIWQFPDYFLRTASFVSYDHKHDLQEQLGNYLKLPERKKAVVMFGNSRTTTFSNEYIARKHPDLILFNFSVPGGTADYYLYRLEQFQKAGIKPDFIYFAVTPQGLNATPSIAMDEVMLEGLSASFVIRYIDHYKPDHISNYLSKKLFWTYQYRPKISVIMDRLANDQKEARKFKNFLANERHSLLAERGSVLMDYHQKPPNDPDFLKHSAEGTWRDFLQPFTPDEGQMDFTVKMLAKVQEMQIPSAMLWTRVGPNLRELNATRNISQKPGEFLSLQMFFLNFVKDLQNQYNSDFIDLNNSESFKCDFFLDSSHMASYCFPEMTDIILNFARQRIVNNA